MGKATMKDQMYNYQEKKQVVGYQMVEIKVLMLVACLSLSLGILFWIK
jgi:hypothetical protein